jgi:hypothetical protein
VCVFVCVYDCVYVCVYTVCHTHIHVYTRTRKCNVFVYKQVAAGEREGEGQRGVGASPARRGWRRKEKKSGGGRVGNKFLKVLYIFI